MSEDEYIDMVKRQRPELFKAKQVKVRPGALEKALRNAYLIGEQNGLRALSQRNYPSLFESIFGKY